VTSISPASAKPADTVTAAGTNLAGITGVILKAGAFFTPATGVAATANSVAFTVPSVANASYTVTLMPGNIVAPSPLTVAAAAAPAPAAVPSAPAATDKPTIDSVFPTTTYPVANRFSFEVNGQHFDPNAANDDIDVQGQGVIPFQSRHTVPAPLQPSGAASPVSPVACAQEPVTNDPCLEASADGRRLLVYGYQRRTQYQGPMKVRVIVNKTASELSGPLTLSRLDPRIVVALALAVFALFMYIVYRLVSIGSLGYTVAGRRYSPLAAFLIDKSTDTYSLSKFQLFALSLVSFFGYIYLFLCRALVQWNFAFPEIPDNYPSLLAISAGTTVAAIGLNATRGGNGGGPVHPSPADFISDGGLVVADRFQFFVWTLIACLGFIALILLQDPATISGFPSFPNGLLYVMGVSAGGYLGGKAVRNPGPILKQVNVTLTGPDLNVVLLGQNLDVNAKYRIDSALQATVGPVVPVQQPQAPTGYSTQLSFTLSQAAGFFAGDHVFEIVNGDGVGSQVNFTGTPMRILPLTYSVPHATAPQSVTLVVTDYREHSSARWLAPGTPAPVDIAESSVTKAAMPAGGALPAGVANPGVAVVPAGAVAVTVRLTPGPSAGKGLLTLVTPMGNTEAASVDVT
jgi:hypothetical protein